MLTNGTPSRKTLATLVAHLNPQADAQDTIDESKQYLFEGYDYRTVADARDSFYKSMDLTHFPSHDGRHDTVFANSERSIRLSLDQMASLSLRNIAGPTATR